MRNRSLLRLGLLLLLAVLALPNRVAADDDSVPLRSLTQAAMRLPAETPNNNVLFQNGRRRDSLANGMLIGAGIGAVVGMLVVPQAMCGSNDSECTTIVRVVVGLPSIAGGLGIGALVDGLHKQNARPAGVAFNVKW